MPRDGRPRSEDRGRFNHVTDTTTRAVYSLFPSVYKCMSVFSSHLPCRHREHVDDVRASLCGCTIILGERTSTSQTLYTFTRSCLCVYSCIGVTLAGGSIKESRGRWSISRGRSLDPQLHPLLVALLAIRCNPDPDRPFILQPFNKIHSSKLDFLHDSSEIHKQCHRFPINRIFYTIVLKNSILAKEDGRDEIEWSLI